MVTKKEEREATMVVPTMVVQGSVLFAVPYIQLIKTSLKLRPRRKLPTAREKIKENTSMDLAGIS